MTQGEDFPYSPLTDLLQGFVSQETYDYLHANALHPHSPVQIFKRHAAIYLKQIINVAYVFFSPVIDAALAAMTASPEIFSVVAFVVLIASVVVVVTWVQRVMMYMTRLAMRIVFWAFVGLMLSFVVKNGVFESIREVVVFGGKVVGFLSVAKNVFAQELRRYEEEARVQGRR